VGNVGQDGFTLSDRGKICCRIVFFIIIWWVIAFIAVVRDFD
tara:strand:+ start:555 stop:680 length:126 start_codon:yes stop_codon:yes gene_type:complete